VSSRREEVQMLQGTLERVEASLKQMLQEALERVEASLKP
jgi:hypothetical protein